MVYCGKPSKACSECRVKRRRCDLQKPSCSQCRRAGIQCTGFRDIRSLLFRDQSSQVKQKNQKRISQSGGNLNTTSNGNQWVSQPSTKGSNILSLSLINRPSLPLQPNSLPFNDQAFQFFIHHYLWNNSLPSINQSGCFTTIYSHASAHGYLSNVIDAVGMASLANLHHAPRLRGEAHQKYYSVIRDVRVALKDPDQAASDQMLVAVMLLNLYETVTCDAMSPNLWNQHAKGASALVELRGLEQLQSVTGRSIFSHLRSDILVNCLQQRKPVPHTLVRWMNEARQFETSLDMPAGELTDIIIRICDLFSDKNECAGIPTAFPEYISTIQRIDADLQTWSLKYKDIYRNTPHSNDSSHPYQPIHHDISSRLSIAHLNNLYYCARIILHEKTIHLLSRANDHSLSLRFPSQSPASDTHRLLIASKTATRSSVKGICHTVRLIRQWLESQERRNDSRAGCYTALIWPLYLAGTAYDTPASERDWITRQLREISELTGVQRAWIAASSIRCSGSSD